MKYEEEFIVNWCDGNSGNYFQDTGREVGARENAFHALFSHVMWHIEPGQKFKITVKIEPYVSLDDWVVVSNSV